MRISTIVKMIFEHPLFIILFYPEIFWLRLNYLFSIVIFHDIQSSSSLDIQRQRYPFHHPAKVNPPPSSPSPHQYHPTKTTLTKAPSWKYPSPHPGWLKKSETTPSKRKLPVPTHTTPLAVQNATKWGSLAPSPEENRTSSFLLGPAHTWSTLPKTVLPWVLRLNMILSTKP